MSCFWGEAAQEVSQETFGREDAAKEFAVPDGSAHLNPFNLGQLGNAFLRLSGCIEGNYKAHKRRSRIRTSTTLPETRSPMEDALELWERVRGAQLSAKIAFSRELLRHTSSESAVLGWDSATMTVAQGLNRRLSTEEADVYYVSMLSILVASVDDSKDPVETNLARERMAARMLPPIARRELNSGKSPVDVAFRNRWYPPKNVSNGPMTQPDLLKNGKLRKRSGSAAFSSRTLGLGRCLPKVFQYLGLRLLQKHRQTGRFSTKV